jgi:ADP-ribosylglycohydrolase
MIGAIIGDTCGSVYEFDNKRSKSIQLFTPKSKLTDDSYMTIATAEHILYPKFDYEYYYRKWFNKYPFAGYGGKFRQWGKGLIHGPYNSWGNGSAMRVSPVGFAFNTLQEVLDEAKKSAECTHNHPEGIKGAQATAAAIFMARTGSTKDEIKDYIEKTFGYNLHRTCDEIRPYYRFNESCQETVPEAIIAFLESTDFEDAIRTGVSLGGDSDTLTCITGGMSQAFYKKIPQPIIDSVRIRIPNDAKIVLNDFNKKFNINIFV